MKKMNNYRKNAMLLQFASLIAAAAIILSAIAYKHLDLNPTLRFAVALVPIATILFFFYTFIRLIRGLDELLQRIHLLGLAIAFGLTCLITFTVGIFQIADIIPSSFEWYFVYVIMVLIYAFVTALVKRRYR